MRNLFKKRSVAYVVFMVSITYISMLGSYVMADDNRNIKGNYFYNPTVDDIPYKPSRNLHGADYVIPDDDWKKEADKRIDKYRKANIKILIKNKAGFPLKNVAVRVSLKRHYFNFGAVATPGFGAGPKGELKKKYFLKYFNAGGFGMSLKPTQCPEQGCGDGKAYKFRDIAEKDMIWLKKHNIKVRGHALIWDGAKFLHANLKKINTDSSLSDEEKGNELFKRATAHFDHAIKKWDVFCWDVANEPRMNHLMDDYLQNCDTFVHWFKLADKLRKKYGKTPKLYYNENQILSCAKVGSYEDNRDIYKKRIQDLLDAKAPIEGIGFQFRFKMPISPETVYERLHDYEEFNLPFQATEFELVSKGRLFEWDAASRKKMIAEMMTLFMSHPLSDGFWHWSFTDNNPSLKNQKKKPYALFSWDGKPRAEMEQWIKMMEVDFNTNVQLKTDAKGYINLRGFKGIYEVTVGGSSKGASTKKVVISLKEDVKTSITY